MQSSWNSSVRSLLIVICLGWLPAMWAPGAWAQGLGELTLVSAINQPFRADIELLDTGELEAAQIVVGLATQEEFDNAGVTRAAVLNGLQFQVEVRGDGTGVVHVTSVNAIEEPYLNFLISARWPNGRMLREYTALLDLPTFTDDNQAPATAIQPPQTVTTPASPQAPAVPAAPATDVAAADQYTVQNGDSMWEIAARTRPGNSVSVQQMMVAIQRANETAFINNNVNRVRSGHVLRIPSSDEISVIDQETAIAAINQQNQQLSSQPLAVNNSGRPANEAPPSDELTLLSGNDAGARAGGGNGGDSIAALENELMLSEESLDRARLENLELTNRLAALQEQVDILEELIALEDAEIAQLQANLSVQAAETEQSLAEAQTAADALANEEAAQSESGIVGLLQNTAVLLGAGVALVLLALVVLLVRRKNVAQADDHSFDFDAAEAEARAAAAATIAEENSAAEATEVPASTKVTWAAAVAAFFARFRKQDDLPDEYQQEQPAAEVTGGSYGPEAAFRNPTAEEEKTEPTLHTEEELLAAEAMADEAFEQLEQEEKEAQEPALSENGTITYIEPTIVPREEDLLAEAGDMMAAVAPAPAVEAPAETSQFQPEALTEEMPQPVQDEETETPDVFEFSLRTEAASETRLVAEPVAEPEAEIESIEFSAVRNETPASAHASEYKQVAELEEPTTELDDDLLDLTFDDTFVADAAEEDSNYMPTVPNNAQDAKLDLAVAYEAMGDMDGAIEILDEVIGAGTEEQIAEAERLKAKWQNS